MTELHTLPATRLATALSAGQLGAEELLDALLARIEAVDPAVGAFLSLDVDGARAAARASDARRAAGESFGPLDGVPVALKDNLCTRGWPTTCSSRMLDGWRPPYDATVVRRLRRGGAVILGKTQLDEFAMGASGAFCGLGRPTRNPWDTDRVAGGSSCGSAAAIAAGMCPLALGSDTGGSVRLPAALTGTVGLLPTYGRVSRYGLIAHASSMDQVGVHARNCSDAALLLGAIAGYDPHDANSLPADLPDYRSHCARGVAGLRIGLPDECWSSDMDDGVREATEIALVELDDAGAYQRPVYTPAIASARSAYLLLACCEASSNLARYDGVHLGHRARSTRRLGRMVKETRAAGFGPEVKRRLLLGTFALQGNRRHAFFRTAAAAREVIRAELLAALEAVDVLVLPTSPQPAWILGARADDPLAMYAVDALTCPANLAGLPAISVPCGSADGLPVGLQVIGPPMGEGVVLRAAAALEQRMGLADRVAEPVALSKPAAAGEPASEHA